MKRVFTYILIGLAIVAGFCLAFTIIMVLVVKDADGAELSDKWMPYISLILVIAIPAVVVWAVFYMSRTFFFKKIRRDEFQKPSKDEDNLS